MISVLMFTFQHSFLGFGVCWFQERLSREVEMNVLAQLTSVHSILVGDFLVTKRE